MLASLVRREGCTQRENVLRMRVKPVAIPTDTVAGDAANIAAGEFVQLSGS